MPFFPEGEYSITAVRQAKKDSFALLESINSTDRASGTVPNMKFVQRIVPADLWTTPDTSDYTPSVETAKVSTYSGTMSDISFIDIDYVPVYKEISLGRVFIVPDSVRASNDVFFSQLANLLHSQAQQIRIGCRGLFPSRDYESLATGDMNAIQLWKRYNEKNREGSRYLDFCLPELCPNTNDTTEWKKFARAHFQDSQRYTKSVYAFLSVKYHPQGDQGDTFVDDTFWTAILECCLRYADGVLIYGEDNVTWANQQAAPWWDATQTFITDLQSA